MHESATSCARFCVLCEHAAANVRRSGQNVCSSGLHIAKIYDTKLQDRRLALEYYRRYNALPDAKGDLVRQATTRITALGTESSTPAQQPDPANEKPAAPATPPSDSGAPWRVAGIITGLVGVVGVGVGVFEGLGAKSQHDTAVNAGCSKSTCPDEKGAQSERDASSAATISTIGFVAGGALMLGGAAMYFLAPAKPKDSADAITTTKVRLTPTVGPQAVGLTLTGQLF